MTEFTLARDLKPGDVLAPERSEVLKVEAEKRGWRIALTLRQPGRRPETWLVSPAHRVLVIEGNHQPKRA